ncbi:MAG: proton-conducting transporter membrane subunit, partial [Candidatus Omnitrophica bacterium]|nr:proton-conducting transporter membrane subunit [Candidatus Omnitrophota bacterium]
RPLKYIMNNFFAGSYFKIDYLNSFAGLAIGLFFVLTLIYSFKFMKGAPCLIRYYTYITLTALASLGAVFANDLILLLVCWGFLGMMLYLLIDIGKGSGAVAKKTFIIVGGSDALMLLGIGIIYYLSSTLQIDKIRLELNNNLATTAYILLAIACFAKAGAMPFHSWIPDCAESAPIPVVAYLPASLDKLLGIYLLARISLNLFVMNEAMNMLLMLVGAFTIIAAVMMALVQHNMKRLLGYHAVSQVGYMVLGIGTGNPIGIAGGLFHMLNHAVYKSCLFFTAGNVEQQTRTSELNELGGLSKLMPITYISCLIASLSISGVPPFNGFVSKWMIGFVSKWMVYQGLIQRLNAGHWPLISVICLVAALFGSALTLASFMKLLHATFLGQRDKAIASKRINEVSWQMWFPCVILAGICVVFGVFANQIPLKLFILPAINGVTFIGTWYAGLSTALIIVGLILGALVFKLRVLKPKIRTDTTFVGGETLDLEEARVTGTDFYNTVKEFGILKSIYNKAERGFFDIYEQGKALIFGIGRFLQFLHNGVLPTYLVWTLLGMIGLFLVLMR